MKINVSFTETFDNLIARLREKYPEEIFDINGISAEKMDVMNFSNKFFHNSANLSDISVDGNANVSERSMVQYNYEINKGLMRMKGLAMLHKQIEETYTTVVADNAIEKVINGELFVNDLHLVNLPYCYAFDIAQLLIDGMDFYGGMMKIKPPKRSDSLIDLVIQTTASLSNQVAGAVSYPSLFILIDAFYRKENGENYMDKLRNGDEIIAKKIRDQFQKLIYSLNFTFRGNQSAFTNVSVLDDGFLDYLFDDSYVLPNGWEIDKPSTKQLSMYFYEYFSEINMKEGMFTFPVVTIALSVDDNNEFIDEELVEWTAKVNSHKSLANIMIDKPTSFSSCCRLRNDFTKLNAYGRQNSFGVGGVSIGCYDDKTEVLTDDGWKLFRNLNGNEKICTLNKESKNIEYHKPTDYISDHYVGKMHHYKNKNYLDLIVTPNHNMLAESRSNGKLSLIKSEELNQGYNLPNLSNGIISKNNDNNIIIGKNSFNRVNFYNFLGIYLGDGWASKKVDKDKRQYYDISISVKKDRKIEYVEKSLNSLGIHFWKSDITENGFIFFRISNKDLWEYLHPLGISTEKYIPRDILKNSNYDEIKSLYDGLINTDGCVRDSGEIVYYTSSEKLSDDFMEVCVKLGYLASKNSRDSCEQSINGNSFISAKRYEIRVLYRIKATRQYSKYKTEVDYNGMVYCVTVPNNTMMVRRNGMISWSGNSHRVVGLNLPRIAMSGNNIKNKTAELLSATKIILDAHRDIINKIIKSGALPLYDTGWMSLKRQYSTVGLVGLYEFMKELGMEIDSDEGSLKASEYMKNIESTVESWQSEDNIYNIESVPAESTAVRLAKIDQLLVDGKYNIYSNQYLPLTKEASIYDRIKLQGIFDKNTSGGAILHINFDESKPMSPETYMKIMDSARELGCKYFGINYVFSKCENDHYIISNNDMCPVCGGEIVDKYTRVVGFLTSVNNWNQIRREEEFPNRKFTTTEGIMGDL